MHPVLCAARVVCLNFKRTIIRLDIIERLRSAFVTLLQQLISSLLIRVFVACAFCLSVNQLIIVAFANVPHFIVVMRFIIFTKIGFVCCEFGSSSVLVSVRGSLSACVRVCLCVHVCFKWFSVDQPVWSMHTKRTTHNIPPKIHWCARWDHQPSVGSWLIRWTHFLV